MSHQMYIVFTELDVPAFLNIIYGRGGLLRCKSGLLPDKEEAADEMIPNMFHPPSKLSVLDAEAAVDPGAAGIALTLPAISSREPREYRAGRLSLSPDSSGAYDPTCLRLFRRIKRGLRNYFHFLPGTGHYVSDRLLLGCREGRWSAACYHGVPIPISDGKESAAKEKEEAT